MSKEHTGKGLQIGDVGRDFKVSGDIVAGNKVVIHNIIHQAAQKIITAPYKFLASYDISDRFIFFGRTGVIEELAGHIPRHKTLIINGQSGAGKTSLINAGLIPHLAENGYFFVRFRDYADPMRQLREYFARHKEFKLEGTDLLSLLQILWAISHRQKSRLVLVLDQFERFFTNVNVDHRDLFIKEFKACMDSDLSAEEMNFVFSIRQDFFGQFVREFEAVIPMFLNECARYHLHPLNREEARDAIVEPLRYIYNIGYNIRFVNEILIPGLMGGGAGTEQVEPPHLQIVCNRLFFAAKKRLKTCRVVEIDRDLYEELGGAQGILQDYLDHCVEEIVQDPKKTNIVRSMLKLMIETTGTRKFVSLREIQDGLPDIKDSPLIKDLIIRLEDARVIEMRGEGEDASYSLSHDFMVKKIQEWLDEREMNRKRAQETLKRGIAEWKSSGSLLNKRQVRIIQKWIITLGDEDKKLLEDSQRAYRRHILQICVPFFLFLLAACVFGYKYFQKQKISDSRKLAALASQTLKTDPSLSFRLAEAAISIWPTFSAQKAIVPPLEYPLHNTAEGHTAEVTIVVFSPNGKRIATGSHDKTARIWNAITGHQLHVLQGHTASIIMAAFSHDGTYIVTSSLDKTARIWDAATGRQLHILEGHTDFVSSAKFSPDGVWVATASWDKTARIWDLARGGQVHVLRGHTDSLSSAEFSPDGEAVITTSGDTTARIWDVATGKQVHVLQGHTASVTTASFSPDGRYVATGSHDNTARVWDVSAGRQIHILKRHTAPIVQAVFSPDGKQVITASKDNTARIWDIATGQQIHVLNGHTDPVNQAAFSPDGRQVITVSADNTGRIWDAMTGQECHILIGHTAPVTSTDYSPDGKWVATASKDNTARIWCTAAGQYIHILKERADTLSADTFSPDGKRIVTASYDESARIWDVATGLPCHVLKGHSGSVVIAAFSPDGDYVVTASHDKTAQLWHVATGKKIHVFEGHKDSLLDAAFSPDGRHIITASKDKTARIWDVDTGLERCILDEHEGPVRRVVFSPDGKLMATASYKRVRIWDACTYQGLYILDGHEGLVSSVMFSRDGKHILTLSEEEMNSHIWDATTGREIHVLKGHMDLVMSAVFSMNGKRVVTASWDKTARIWDVASGRLIHVLSEHTNIVNSAVFSPDGKRVITASEDKTACIWAADSGQLLYVLKGHKDGLDAAVFSPDGTLIVTASKDETVRTWPGDYHEVLKYINHKRIRGNVRMLTKNEKKKYGII
ncbi:MAG: eIF2A-related protein [bacterium]